MPQEIENKGQFNTDVDKLNTNRLNGNMKERQELQT